MFCLSANTLLAASLSSITTSSDTEINFSVYPAEGDQLLLWFYSEAGPQNIDSALAHEIAKSGTEVWIIDLFDSYFLPVALSSMDKIPAIDISDFIEAAHKQTGKRIIPVTTGRSAIPLLRGARHWQVKYPTSQALTGIILISPKFYIETPDPGLKGKLMPVVKNSNLLLFIMQPEESPWFWKLDTTIPALESSGSDVFLQPVKDVRDRFYFRPDADSFEDRLTKNLPSMLNRAITALNKFPRKERVPSSVNLNNPANTINKKEKALRPHKGDSKPPELRLTTSNNSILDIKDFKDTVILVNFWASWCPPCVHEMPSMQRLQNSFSRDDFIIFGVNMAEEKSVISQFLKNKVSVNFPILMDSDGTALKRWSVFAFPTSYVIDKKGQIRYSLFGSIEWDDQETISIIKNLIDEKLF